MRRLMGWMTVIGLAISLGLAAGCSENPDDDDPPPAADTGMMKETGEEPQPALQVVEEVIIEGAVVGETSEEEIVFRNAGEATLTVSSVSLTEGDEDEVADEYARGGSWFESVDLAPGASKSLEVAYTPENKTADTAEVTVETNDPANVKATVDVKVAGGFGGDVDPEEPCLQMKPGEQKFGKVPAGETDTRSFTLAHCRQSGKPLKVTRLALADDGGDGVFALPGDVSAPFEVAAGESKSIEIEFTPTDTIQYTGRIEVETNASSHASFLVALTGTGKEESQSCGSATARAKVKGTNTWQRNINTNPMDTVVLDGSTSSISGGSVDRYEWSFITRPQDSNARLQPNATSVNPELFLDLNGTYRLQLTIYDASGECMKVDELTIQAVSGNDIEVELVWDTNADPDQTDDSGADVDLHYLNESKGNQWNSAPWDVFWYNDYADWGTRDDPSDNPLLVADDDDGSGPERLIHNNPASGQGYTVGVYYYDDHGFGPSYATVRIYIDGKLQKEYKNKYLSGTFDFWEVATINWPTKDIYTKDRKFNGFPMD